MGLEAHGDMAGIVDGMVLSVPCGTRPVHRSVFFLLQKETYQLVAAPCRVPVETSIPLSS